MLVVVLVALIGWLIWQARSRANDSLVSDVETEVVSHHLTRRAAWTWLVVGVALLVISSRILVWGLSALPSSLAGQTS